MLGKRILEVLFLVGSFFAWDFYFKGAYYNYLTNQGTTVGLFEVATGNTIFSISSSLIIFFLPKVLFLLQQESYFKTLVLLTQKTRRFDSTDYFY